MNSVTKNSIALDYCINKAIPDGSNLYYATLFEAEKNKAIIIGLHAFLYELTEIIQECSDPGLARVKLHWWQEEIERLFHQQPRHPITRYLNECLTLDQNITTSFNSIINSFDNFLFIDQTEIIDTTLNLYDSTAGETWQLCATLLGVPDSISLQNYRAIGNVYHYLRCLQEPNTYITESRCIIPESIIKQDDLLNLKLSAQNNSINQIAIFSPLITALKVLLEEHYAGLRKNDYFALKHGLILNRLALKTCDEIINGECEILNKNISLTPIRKLGIAWWTHFIS
ncbi:MAG: squalene synthase HpnD [marine bacterium B5-7]|nr:MAG: squalene synthase HpnD [marine bacterium B5-7]